MSRGRFRLSHSRVALAGQSVALQARRQRDVADDAATAAALQTHLGGLRPHGCGRDDDAMNLHQTRHLLGLQSGDETWRESPESSECHCLLLHSH